MALQREIPEGYTVEWRVDPSFELLPGGTWRTCSMIRCLNTAVAVLWRPVRRKHGCGKKRQFCCLYHMYGREIKDGKVMEDCLVEVTNRESNQWIEQKKQR